MKALVLSGGSGMRLRPFSHSMAKQMMPIANKPVLEYVLLNIRALGVTEIGIIVGDRAQEIIDFAGDGSRFGARVTYIHQDRPLGLAHCVILARSFLADDDFVMYLGDNMLPHGVADVALDFAAQRPTPRCWCTRWRTRAPSGWWSWTSQAGSSAWWRSRRTPGAISD